MQTKISPNSYTPGFGMIWVYSTKMTYKQKSLGNKIQDKLCTCPQVRDADYAGVDVYILPDMHNEDTVKIRYLDCYNDNFYKNGQKYLQTQGKSDEKLTTITGRIKRQLESILSGSVQAPNGSKEDMARGECDLANIRPELFEDLSI